jgi:hypothetical protein
MMERWIYKGTVTTERWTEKGRQDGELCRDTERKRRWGRKGTEIIER